MNDVVRQPIDQRAAVMMLVLCVVWGLQQVAIKAAAADVAPVLQIVFRSALACVLLYVVMRIRGERLFEADGTLPAGLLTGVFFALEYLFVAEGLRYTTASHMAIFLYTCPIFVALGLHCLHHSERLSAVQWLGVLLAFMGVVIAFAGHLLNPFATSTAASTEVVPLLNLNAISSPIEGVSAVLFGDFLGLLAGLSWGAATITIRSSALADTSPIKTLLYQLSVTVVLLLVMAWYSGQWQFQFTAIAVWSLTFQTVIFASLSLLLWLWLLRRYLSSRLSVLSFMSPLFGVAFGVVLLDDPLDLHFILGAVGVVLGIVIVSGADKKAKRSTKLASS